MRLFLAAATMAALVLTSHPAEAQRGGNRACMQEVVKICGRDRSKIRECLRANFDKLSSRCQQEIRKRAGDRGANSRSNGDRAASRTRPTGTIVYGTHKRQAVDLYVPSTLSPGPPLVAFIHGGGWSFGERARVDLKPTHFNALGYAFASIGYRVLPDAQVEEQAGDIASAIVALRGQASAWGYDPDRIVLMGHSAGAHLAALVATDESLLEDDLAAIRGVVLLDGAGYDVPRQMASRDIEMPQIYARAFGENEARQLQLSPITHTSVPNAPAWLALYVSNRDVAREQSEALMTALRNAGANTVAHGVADTDHRRINREIGTSGDPGTELIDAFLAKAF